MPSIFEETKFLNDSGDGLLCRIHLLKNQFSSGEIPHVLRQVEYQKIRSKLEKTPVIESSDFLKVRIICITSLSLILSTRVMWILFAQFRITISSYSPTNLSHKWLKIWDMLLCMTHHYHFRPSQLIRFLSSFLLCRLRTVKHS